MTNTCKESKFLHPQTNILTLYTSLMFIQPPPYFHSFHHLFLQTHPLLPLPCPSLSVSSSYLLLPSSSFPLLCHPPLSSYPGGRQLLLNGSITECICFVNNSTGTRWETGQLYKWTSCLRLYLRLCSSFSLLRYFCGRLLSNWWRHPVLVETGLYYWAPITGCDAQQHIDLGHQSWHFTLFSQHPIISWRWTNLKENSKF